MGGKGWGEKKDDRRTGGRAPVVVRVLDVFSVDKCLRKECRATSQRSNALLEYKQVASKNIHLEPFQDLRAGSGIAFIAIKKRCNAQRTMSC